MSGNSPEGVELPDRGRGHRVDWDDDEDLERLDDADTPTDETDVAATDDTLADDSPGESDDADADDDDSDDDADDDNADDDSDEDDEDEDDDEDDADEVDFALVAYREAGRWHADPLPPDDVRTWEGFRVAVLGRAGETGVLGFASIDDSALVVLRPTGSGARVVLSDLETADYLAFAEDLLDHLRRTDPSIDDLVESTEFGESEDAVPVGDLGLLADLGISGEDLRELCEDMGADPEDLLEEIGDLLKIGRVLGDAVDAASG